MTRLRIVRTRRFFGGRLHMHTGRLPFTLPSLMFRWQGAGRPDPLDYAMWTVWLESGKWRWVTQKMTTEAREAAVAAVLRYDRAFKANEPQEDLLTRESLAWWD